jgi:hypothetical protein
MNCELLLLTQIQSCALVRVFIEVHIPYWPANICNSKKAENTKKSISVSCCRSVRAYSLFLLTFLLSYSHMQIEKVLVILDLLSCILSIHKKIEITHERTKYFHVLPFSELVRPCYIPEYFDYSRVMIVF